MNSSIRYHKQRDRTDSRKCAKRSRSRRLRFEVLETRLAPAGIVNGDFAISNPSDPNYGWTTRGNASIANGQGILNEATTVQSEFSQSFTIPQGATQLRFVIVANGLVSNGSGNPPDAFEAALLNSQTQQPLVGPPTGLSSTDSFLNIQQTGEVFFAPQVTVPGAGTSGAGATLTYPELVTVDVSSVAANTQATLFFDLIGVAPVSSSMRITDVTLVSGATPPPVTIALDPATDSGAKGDNLTNFNPVNLLGTTDPNQTVMLAIGNDGFTDGTTTADATGHFTFSGVHLVEGSNLVRVQATNAQGSSVASQTITVDTQAPTGALVTPMPNATTNGDLGYVDIQWTDHGVAGIDPTTFGTGNVTVTGVTVDQVQDLGNNLERYRYNLDGNTLPIGAINVTLVAGQVADKAANFNVAATQTFTLQPAPSANAQSVTAAQDTAKAITLTGSDPNLPPLPLTYTITANPAHGELSGAAPGLTYTPSPGYFGPDSFQFKVNDGLLDSSAATVTITVVGKPTAKAQSVTAAVDTAAPITLAGTDPNTPAQSLTFAVSATPAHGVLSGTAPNLTYTPNSGFVGTDTFQFKDTNGVATSSPATVTITVVGQPAATSFSATTGQGTPTAIVLTGTDPDSPPRALSFTVTVNPAHGVLTGTAPSLTYTPDSSFTGTDRFDFITSNGVVTSAPATVTIHVVGKPAASAQSVTAAQGTSTAIALVGTDPNSPPLPLTFIVTVKPTHGTLSGTGPTFEYSPNTGYLGPDTFQFKVNNGTLDSNVATVSIAVVKAIRPPVTNANSYKLTENTTLTVPAPGILGNDTGETGHVLTAVLVSGPAHGTLVLNPNGSFSYTPTTGFAGSDSFTYHASDSGVAGNTATVHLAISAPSGPISLLPNTPYFRYLQHRRTLNPTRFDTFHPQIGALLGLELSGIPTRPTKILPNNAKFNALRSQHARNPAAFSASQPIIGALLSLESIQGSETSANLLPDTPQIRALLSLRAKDPAAFDQTHVYYAAILALEAMLGVSAP
jgi:hypothetical protein